MTRAHFVKAARKDYPEHGIKKGESYYWWKFMQGGRGGPKCFSKVAPKPSQLTQSEFLGAMYDLSERVASLSLDAEGGLEALKADVDDLVSEIRELGEQQEEKLSNLPDSLQQGPTGETLQSRADSCEDWAGELEGIDLDLSRDEGESEEDFKQRTLDAVGELQWCEYQGGMR